MSPICGQRSSQGQTCVEPAGHSGHHGNGLRYTWSRDGRCTATAVRELSFFGDWPTQCGLQEGHEGAHRERKPCPKATIFQHGHVQCSLEAGHADQHYSAKLDHHWGPGECSKWRIAPVPSWEGCLWQIYDPLGVLRDVKATLGEAMDALHP